MTRVAVVGTGFGCRVHVPALRAAGFDVVALVGSDPHRTARRAEREAIPHACSSLETALDLDVDAVTVATPPDTHARLAITALNHGAHVLCEKPFAVDVSQAEAMSDIARHRGLVGLVAHEFRFAPERAAIAQLVADGAIGQPRVATLVQHLAFVADRATPLPSWWFDDARGGGWLLASGSHVIDQVRHWLGDIARVDAGARMRRGDDADDGFAAQLRMESGCVVSVTQSASTWGPPSGITRIAGDEGSVWLDDERNVWLATSADPVGVLALPTRRDDPSDDPRHRYTHLELEPFTALCRAFRAAIDGGSSGAAATFADGVATQRVLDQIRQRG